MCRTESSYLTLFLLQLGPADNCNSSTEVTLDQADKNAIVAKHNEFRSRVSLGQENNAKGGINLPKAADMRKMVKSFTNFNLLFFLLRKIFLL